MMSIRNSLLGCAAAGLCFGLAAGPGAAQETETATAAIKDRQGQQVGTASLQDAPGGVLLTVEISGVPEGPHGFHIHAVGACEPPFESAAGHFNPEDAKHGIKSEEGKHAGDLPNLHVPASGQIKVDVFAQDLALEDLFDDDGSALIVHANADDYETDPTGNAGDRIACGVIEK
jgi:Cu-Zn family superoxide dismutase